MCYNDVLTVKPAHVPAIANRGAALKDLRRAEEAIRRSEERYRRLFEQNLAGVCRYTLDGKLLDANPAYAHIFGYNSPEEIDRILGAVKGLNG